MLTAELARVRAKGGELQLVPLNDKSRAVALQMAERYQAIVRDHHQRTYGELKEAWRGVDVGPRDKKLALGLQKLIEDELELDTETPYDPRALRSLVFLEAARARRERPYDFGRAAILEACGAGSGIPGGVEAVEEALFADLKSQRRIAKLPRRGPEQLLAAYELGQVQAVLLRATHLSLHIVCRTPSVYRDVFRALKFRRLLYTMEAEGDGYRVEVDGPFSLFESVTKYGVQLALVLPALLACDRLTLVANVRWGKARTELVFRFASHQPAALASEGTPPPEICELKRRIEQSGSEWQVAHNERILQLPGVGVIVPDLVFQKEGQSVYFELLGFWSRDAVWKRVELVEKGFAHRIVFGVSTRLRVSEAVLDEEPAAALYTFKGTLDPRRVLEKVAAVARS